MGTNVTVKTNGPILLQGDFKVLDPTGKAFDLPGRPVVALCRCGHSANKPLCDGSHAKAGFQSECLARSIPPPAPK